MIKDDLDKKIVDVLQLNARLSYTEISKRVNLSPSAVTERIQRLEDSGVIKGYGANLDYQKMGRQIMVYISIRFRGTGCSALRRDIHMFPEFLQCSRVTGQEDMIIKAAVKDNLALEDLVDRLYEYGDTCTNIILSDMLE